jgi:hypothetical protein
MDQSKKTMRHFYCRDVLWETFEQMANDFDCSIDYLVNEAMRYYARSKNYQSPGAPGANGPGPTNPPPMGNPGGGGGNGAPSNHFGANGPAAKPLARSNAQTSQPPMPAAPMGANGANGPMASQQRRPAPPTPGYSARAANPNNTAGPTSHMPSSSPREAPASMPPPNNNAPSASGPTLFLIYNGQRYPVTKDQFIIGRGSKTSDLPIKDGNISRKHAAVIRRNGTFYIKDLGSTNGIDYKGMRIDNKRIDEGDVFHLCDYELRFTYRADG